MVTIAGHEFMWISRRCNYRCVKPEDTSHGPVKKDLTLTAATKERRDDR
jgi:hypothetical protein